MSLPLVCTPPKKKQRRVQEPRPNCGRKPFTEKFEQLVLTVEEFVRGNGFKAHKKRRSATGNTCGTSLKQLKKHVIENVSDLDTVSERTLHRLMDPPSEARNTKNRYKGLVKAKLAKKRNDVRKENMDGHYYASRVRYRLEFGTKFEDETLMLSADCMNKVNIGGLAVSRYHHLRRFFPAEDLPNFLDHDFPVSKGYKITPSGYMVLSRKESVNPITCDKLGRTVFQFSRTGPEYIFNRVESFRSVNIQSHVNNLDTILNREGNGKRVIILCVDGGSDWNTKSWTARLFLGRLFKRRNLDILCATTYGPGLSVFNTIEHLWSPLSNKLSALMLPACIPGETVPPSAQTGITEKARLEKEALVFNAAMERCGGYWEDSSFDGFPVSTFTEPCNQMDTPWSDYAEVHNVLKAPTQKKLRDHPTLMAELKFISNHCGRRIGEFTLMKCRNLSCDHCTTNPPQGKAIASIFDHGGMPTPVVDRSFPGPDVHYYTYMQAMQRPLQTPRENMEKFSALGLGRCSACKYVFSLKQDQHQHMAIIHR
ncbi:hypothetical protein HOLleu_32412 [Holothuria leucospilota]|uniref:C2H2-type domain-containing protein n=1 Tax=Holothuria leucospilota TaxID=206669 RepID=A0A9Q1BIN6_HOLLE|nr:hypothetical protein HOLleu_32412 [Holothuria leucospilota]